MIYDPDYARAYSIIRCTAWAYGYAALLHGSFTRDLDVVLVPWTDRASITVEHLFNLLAERTGLKLHPAGPTVKPHGRIAHSLLFPAFGDPRWVDLSILPTKPLDTETSR